MTTLELTAMILNRGGGRLTVGMQSGPKVGPNLDLIIVIIIIIRLIKSAPGVALADAPEGVPRSSTTPLFAQPVLAVCHL